MKFKFIVSGSSKRFGNSAEPSAPSGPQKVKKPRSLIVLILANLVPIIGVLFFGWSLFEVIYLYWLESAVIGLYGIPKMLLAKGDSEQRERFKQTMGWFGFYAAFLGAEIFGLTALFGGPGETPLPGGVIKDEHFAIFWRHRDIIPAALAVFGVSHGVSFVQNFIRKKEFLHTTRETQARAPFNRILFLHFVLGIGTALTIELRSAFYMLLLFVVLKTIIDVFVHLREHGRFAALRTGGVVFTVK